MTRMMKLSRRIPAPVLGVFLAALWQGPVASAGDLSGVWRFVVVSGQDSREYRLELKQAGDSVRGFMISPRSRNRYPAEGALQGSSLQLNIVHGEETLKADLKVEGEKIAGTFESNRRKGRIEGSRGGAPAITPAEAETPRAAAAAQRDPLVGKWNSVATYPTSDGGEGTLKAVLEVSREGGKLAGKMTGESGSLNLKSIETDGRNLHISLIYPTDDGDREIRIEGAFVAQNELKGRWKTTGGEFSGSWIARRAAVADDRPAREGPPRPDRRLALGDQYLVKAFLPDGDVFVASFVVQADGEKLGGYLILPDGGRVKISSGSLKGEGLEAELNLPYQGQVQRLQIRGELGDGGILEGVWKTDQESGRWIGRPLVEL